MRPSGPFSVFDSQGYGGGALLRPKRETWRHIVTSIHETIDNLSCNELKLKYIPRCDNLRLNGPKVVLNKTRGCARLN